MMKRAAEALRRQDWTAISIEFVLVVVGVLLAFQISQWSAGRDEERIRKDSIGRLLRESEQDVAVLEDQHRFQKKFILENMRIAAENLNNPSPPEEIRQKMIDGISGSAVMPKPPAPDTVYNELIASGRFGAIGDTAMRDAVSNYASMMKYLLQGIDYARMGLSGGLGSAAIHPTYDPTSERYRRVEIDFKQFSTDRAAQDKFLTRLSLQRFNEGNTKETLEAARMMCAEVARVAGSTCQPRRMASTIE